MLQVNAIKNESILVKNLSEREMMMIPKKYECCCLSKEKWAFGWHVVWSRWFTILASVVIMSVKGATYLFGVYSNTIKSLISCVKSFPHSRGAIITQLYHALHGDDTTSLILPPCCCLSHGAYVLNVRVALQVICMTERR